MDKSKNEKIGTKLRDLRSLIAHAKEVEQTTVSIVDTLRIPSNPGAYHISADI